MAEPPTTATTDTAKAPITSQPPVTDNQSQAEQDTNLSSSFGKRAVNAIGGGSPETPPASFGKALEQMPSTSMQSSMLRQLQRDYGNRFVGEVIQSTAKGKSTTTGTPPQTSTSEQALVPEATAKSQATKPGTVPDNLATTAINSSSPATQEKADSSSVSKEAPSSKSKVASKMAEEKTDIGKPVIPALPPASSYDLTLPTELVSSNFLSSQPVESLSSDAKFENTLSPSTLIERLRINANNQKTKLLESAAQLKANVAADGSAQQELIRSTIIEQLNTITSEINQARSNLKNQATKQKTRVKTTVALGFSAALGKTIAQNSAIDKSAKTYKEKAGSTVKTHQDAVRKFGTDEGKRGKAAMDKQASEAWTKGQTKASTYPDDERGQVQAQAVLKIAAEVAEKLPEQGPELQSKMQDVGEDLAKGLEGVQEQVVKTIDEQTPNITKELFKQAISLWSFFETIQKDVLKGIDDFVEETNQKLDEVGKTAKTELKAIETTVVAQIDTSVISVQGIVDQETNAVIVAIDKLVETTVTAINKTKRPDSTKVQLLIESAESNLNLTAKQFISGLNETESAVHQEFTKGQEGVTSKLANITSGVSSSLVTVTESTNKGLQTLGDKAKEGSDKVNEEWDKALADTQTTVDTKYGELISGLDKEITKNLEPGKRNITAEVDKAIAKNREPLDQLDTKMEEAAKEARDKYDAPWYEKVGRWVWNAIKSFITAVLYLLLFVAIIILAIVLIIVGLVFDIVALIIIGLLILVGLVVYMVWEIAKGWYNRVMSAKTWWQAAWAGIVGVLDIVGIPGVIEGIIQHDIVNGRKLTEEEAGQRFGSGLLGVILLILPLKVKPKAPVEAPPIPRPIEIPKTPLPPEVPKVPSPAEAPKATPPAEAPKVPSPAEAPKVPSPAEAPKATPPAEAPKATPPAETPKEPSPTEKPPADNPKEPSPTEKPPAEKPKEPSPTEKPPELPKEPEPTPAEIEKAKINEAEALENGKRFSVKNKADLAKLKEKAPVKDKPPEGIKADDPLWNKYVDYWHERVSDLEKEFAENPNAKPKTKPPLEWKAYNDFRGKFARGVEFQEKVTEALKKEKPNLNIQDDVGVAKEGGGSTKFVDQLGVDKSKVEAWKEAGKPKDSIPDVESYSNKSRDFRKTNIDDVRSQVEVDVNEALDKYGGKVEIRRRGHPLFGQTAKVSKVTLVYEAKLVPIELRGQIRASVKSAAQGKPVEVIFK
jgi:hypothetical protein